MSAPGTRLGFTPEDLKIRAARVALESGPLPETVASGHERRCPFLKVEQDETKDDTPMVDGICDVRIQRFSDTIPFGPLDLQVCELCIRSKTYEVQSAAADAQMEMLANAQAAAEEAEAQDQPPA